MKKQPKTVVSEEPIFGLDTQEIAALRQLAEVVGKYLNESVDLGELDAAYHHFQRIKRNKRVN